MKFIKLKTIFLLDSLCIEISSNYGVNLKEKEMHDLLFLFLDLIKLFKDKKFNKI
jgi:hypothetical protein